MRISNKLSCNDAGVWVCYGAPVLKSPQSNLLVKYGPRALITGASSGIGESFAKSLAKLGFELVITARRGDRLKALAEELGKSYGTKVTPFVCDLGSQIGAQELLEFLSRENLEISLLVNNAGYGLQGEFDNHPLEGELGMIDLNCRSVVHLTHGLVKKMKEKKAGGIIITSSVLGAVPAPWFTTYGATKSFDLYFGEALYAELKEHKVDVLVLMPGLTRTEFQIGAGMRDYHSPYRTADQVVTTGLNALGKKSTVVDGWLNKFLVHGTRLLPRCVVLWISRAVMKYETRPVSRY